MNKFMLYALVTFLVSCSQKVAVIESGNSSPMQLVNFAFQEVSSNWDLRENSIISPAFKLSETDAICAKFVLYLSSNKSHPHSSFEEQLLYSNGKRFYALSAENKACQALDEHDFFRILSLDGSDTPNFALFRVGEFLLNRQFNDNSVSVIYHDEISRMCLSSESNLNILEVIELESGDEGLFDSYSVNFKCAYNGDQWYVYTLLNEYFDGTVPNKRVEVISADAFPIDNRRLVDELIQEQ